MIVHVRHIKVPNLKYCSRGARVWFELHKLNWNEFVMRGLPEEVLLATGDAMARDAVEEARREWAESQKNKP